MEELKEANRLINEEKYKEAIAKLKSIEVSQPYLKKLENLNRELIKLSQINQELDDKRRNVIQDLKETVNEIKSTQNGKRQTPNEGRKKLEKAKIILDIIIALTLLGATFWGYWEYLTPKKIIVYLDQPNLDLITFEGTLQLYFPGYKRRYQSKLDPSGRAQFTVSAKVARDDFIIEITHDSLKLSNPSKLYSYNGKTIKITTEKISYVNKREILKPPLEAPSITRKTTPKEKILVESKFTDSIQHSLVMEEELDLESSPIDENETSMYVIEFKSKSLDPIDIYIDSLDYSNEGGLYYKPIKLSVGKHKIKIMRKNRSAILLDMVINLKKDTIVFIK